MTTRITITIPATLADSVAFLASVHRLPVSRMWASIAAGDSPCTTTQLRLIVADCTRTTATRERAGVLLCLLLDART